MAFDRIFQGPPIAEVASNGPETCAFGVDVVNTALYLSAGGGWVPVTYAALPATVGSTTFYVDGNRVDTYIADGSILRPYKTIGAALTAMSKAAPYVLWINPGTSAYVDANPSVNANATAVTIFGNHAAWQIVSGAVTLPCPCTVYDLNTTGTVNYTYTGTSRNYRYGGSINGSVTFSGNTTIWGGVFTNASVIFVANGANVVLDNCQVVGELVTQGATSQLTLQGGTTVTTASAAYNINVSAGGFLNLQGVTLSNGGTAMNINAAGSATVANPNYIRGTTMNTGMFCGAAPTLVDQGSVIPVSTGTAINTFIGVLYNAATAPLPTASVANVGMKAVVTDATAPSYLGAYTGGGRVTATVICSYSGSVYAWLTC